MTPPPPPPPDRDGDDLLEIPVVLELLEAYGVCGQWLQARALWLEQDFTGLLSPLSPVWIKVSVAAYDIRVSARCVQLSPHGAAFEFRDLDALRRLLDHVGAGEEPSPGLDTQETATPEHGNDEEKTEVKPKEKNEEAGEGADLREGAEGEEATEVPEEPQTDGMGSLYHRLKVLTIEEKKRLAVKANQPERHFLARDNAQGIHIYVLRNPGVTAAEVANFLKFPRFSVDAILHIAKTQEWMANRRVALGMCMHTRTPVNITRRLVEKLNVRDLRSLQRSGKLNPLMAKVVKTRINKLNLE